MAQVKVVIDGVPYYGTVDGPDDLKETLEHTHAVAMGAALGKAVR